MGILVLIMVGAVLLALVAALIFLSIRKPRIGLIAFAILISAVTSFVLTWQPIYKTRLPRFADDVKNVISAKELQDWAVTTLSKTTSDSYELPLKEVPDPLRNFRSEGCLIENAFYEKTTSSGSNYIVLVWGGGFGHWGIDVGPPSFEQPEDDNFYIKWAPGVYFWAENK